MKEDLEYAIVRCPLVHCGDNGRFPRCYLDIYKFCKIYMAYELMTKLKNERNKKLDDEPTD